MSEELAVSNKEKLVTDLKVVISDADEILRATAGLAGEKVGELRERIQLRLRDAKERLADAEAAIVDKTKACARATDDFVHEQPWKAVGVAAALGLAFFLGTSLMHCRREGLSLEWPPNPGQGWSNCLTLGLRLIMSRNLLLKYLTLLKLGFGLVSGKVCPPSRFPTTKPRGRKCSFMEHFEKAFNGAQSIFLVTVLNFLGMHQSLGRG